MGVRCACPAGLGSIWALSESWLAECFDVAGWPLWVACVRSLPGCEVRGYCAGSDAGGRLRARGQDLSPPPSSHRCAVGLIVVLPCPNASLGRRRRRVRIAPPP